MKRAVLRPQARRELRAAARWYERQQPGLAARFLDEIASVITLLSEHPELNPIWRDGRPYRRAVVEQFPYLVFYVELEDQIRVLAIAHARRRPGYWLRRGPS